MARATLFTAISLTVVLAGCGAESAPDHGSKTTTAQAKVNAQDGFTFSAAVQKITPDPLVQKHITLGETYNAEAPIPPQCYTKTESKFNPCYTCHQTYEEARPNQLNDGFLQGSYAFSDFGTTNRWQNLFKDRRDYVDSVSDEEILSYISQDNYSPLIEWMKSDEWQGTVPELKNLHKGADAFDEYGLAKDGSRWVAFNYKPLPSTFWPTNGSTDDVMIRLPEQFSEVNGEFSRDLYFANLSLLEMAITGQQEISTLPLNEAALDIDLDGDSVLAMEATRITRRSHYLGDANQIPLTPELYPEGTAFLHTVRYVGVREDGSIYNPPRMKEVRYMVKDHFRSPTSLKSGYYVEAKEKHFGKLPIMVDHRDRGMANKFGWLVWGFIEDENGKLRKQHHEEQAFCMGCHRAVGTSIDHTFAFPRKVAGASGWGYIDLTKITDVPSHGETRGEYANYLHRVGGGDEFRQNQEMLERWFHSDGTLNWQKVESTDTIYELITPSRERALALNKAYHAIVREQSYLYGRDAVLHPAINVFETVDPSVPPLEPENRHQWDIRLDWGAAVGSAYLTAESKRFQASD